MLIILGDGQPLQQTTDQFKNVICCDESEYFYMMLL